MKYLVGDIGGTNARLAYYDSKKGLTNRSTYSSKKFKSIAQIVKLYRNENMLKVNKACFAVAGPVVNGIVKATNLPWTINPKTLAKQIGLHTFVVNDFVSNCYGLSNLHPSKILVLNKGKQSSENIAVIGAGTGLGQGFIVTKEKIVIASEGGHCDFSPQTKEQLKLYNYLAKKYGRVSFERVLCGQGIEDIYSFLHKKQKCSMKITKDANRGKQKDKKTIQLFARVYGQQAGNLVLNVNAFGGVYVTGGIAPSIFPKFKKEFLQGFVDKGRFTKHLKETKVKVVTTDDLGIIGAGKYLERQL